MRHPIALSIAVCIAGLAALSASAKKPTANAAEYAIRWNPRQGGPATAEAALEALSPAPSDTKPKSAEFDVQYFSVAKPPDLPADVSAILRERKKSKKTELTFKLRGPRPFPTPLASWACPVEAAADEKDAIESKDELDCSFLSRGDPKCVRSRSCTAASAGDPAIPETLHAEKKGCPAHVRRLEAGDRKVEEWHVGEHEVLIEVSQNANDGDAARKHFRDAVVSVLLDQKIVPLEASKTELGGECRP